MRDNLPAETRALAAQFGLALGVGCAVFDYGSREFAPEAGCAFCAGCRLAAQGGCVPATTHRYGSFEAVRWNGMYIYYCPLSLAFASTTVADEGLPALALVSGPVVIGATAELLADEGAGMEAEIAALPVFAPARLTALAQTQRAVCRQLAAGGEEAGPEDAQAKMFNTLYEVTDEIRGGGARYPVDIEQKLQRMIIQGDRQGAQELINQLLGHLYFNSGGDFTLIKRHALELVVLFSRAAIEGGADAQQIFGQYRDVPGEIERFKSLDELSVFLTAVFYRFVGYVFDFSQVAHTNILYKAVNYVREHYAEKLTLEEVAQHVGLSRSYLSTIFREEFGIPFTDFVSGARVEKSRELLLDSALSLAEIADLVGFSDQSYFTKVFSRMVGMSPGQYRKRRGK